MNRCLPMACALLALPLACAQGLINGPASPLDPQSVQAQPDGKCRAVKPGDIVHYTLTIQSVDSARAVYADLQMRPGRSYVSEPGGLPPPDFRNLGGGGPATRDAQQGGVYHFAFTVPHDVVSGIYHGAGVYVTAAESNDISNSSRSIDINRKTISRVRDFCLIVVGSYNVSGRPLVTNFKPGPIDKTK
jgi:hypothetical protein